MTAAITHMEIAAITKEVAKAFDYQSLAPDVAVQARAVVTRIRRRGANIQTAIFEIGQDLLWAKEALACHRPGNLPRSRFGLVCGPDGLLQQPSQSTLSAESSGTV